MFYAYTTLMIHISIIFTSLPPIQARKPLRSIKSSIEKKRKNYVRERDEVGEEEEGLPTECFGSSK